MLGCRENSIQSWLGTLPSELARSTVSRSPVRVGPDGRWTIERDPRRHIMADFSSEKLILHLSQCNILLYGLLCLSAIREASLL